MLGKVFKAYDIRATYPKPLSEKLAWQIGYGTAQYLLEQADQRGQDDPMMRHVVVGRDMRKSSPALAAALKQGIRDFGAHVVDVGMVDTPLIYFAINHLGCCGGVQTTASHNPANYNGFKISKMNARPVGVTTGLDDIRRFAALADRDKLTTKPGREGKRDLWEDYRGHVRQFLHPKLLSGSRTLKVVIDASNGMAGTMINKVFADVSGLSISKLNFDNTKGEFVHPPDPLVKANLEQLRERVWAVNADFGVCFDGDADRCVIVDEHAEIIGGDHLTAWLASIFLRDDPGAAIVYDLRSSKSLPEVIGECGGRALKCRVGHVFMKQAMAQFDAVFGGELSGHFYFRKNFYADSGAIAFAAVASGLAASNKSISGHIRPVRRYVQSGEINFETDDKEAALDDLKRAYRKAKNVKIDELDGLTIDLGSWWCNVRPSNTEPLLRLNLEGPNETVVKAKIAEVSQYLGKRVAH